MTRKLTLKVRILHILTPFTQLPARLKNFLMGQLLILGLKECLVECAILFVKSEVILRSLNVSFNWSSITFGSPQIFGPSDGPDGKAHSSFYPAESSHVSPSFSRCYRQIVCSTYGTSYSPRREDKRVKSVLVFKTFSREKLLWLRHLKFNILWDHKLRKNLPILSFY